MSISCEINFENDKKVFHAGEMLRGNIHLKVKKNTTVSKVSVRIMGKAYATWGKYYRSPSSLHYHRKISI